MISDTLSDASAAIVEQLDMDCYRKMPIEGKKLIFDALDAMQKARIYLDTPPVQS